MLAKRSQAPNFDSIIALPSIKAKLSRRDFLKAMGAIAGSAMLSACGSVIETIPSPTSTSLPTQIETLIPTTTKTALPISTRTPDITPTPKLIFEMPLTVDNKFDFSDFDHYPTLNNLRSDLDVFIQESQGFKRDFSQAMEGVDVTNLPLKVIDNRNHPNNARGIAIAYALTREPILNGTQPYFGVSAAKFSMNAQNEDGSWFQLNTFVILQQHFIPEAGGKSEIAVGICPDYDTYREKITQIGSGAWMGALMADFIPEVLEGSLPWRGNLEPIAAALHQNNIPLSGNRPMLDMVAGQYMPPGINGKLFVYAPGYVNLK